MTIETNELALNSTNIDHKLSVKYLKSDFTLEKRELFLYYSDSEEARDSTVKLMLAAMNLNAMRLNPLYRTVRLKDLHKTGHYESQNREIMFMNIRLYQINIRKSVEIELYDNVSIHRIYTDLRGYEYLQIYDRYYSIDRIRKTLGACYRSRLRRCSVSWSDDHPYLCFFIKHSVLMINCEPHAHEEAVLTNWLIEPRE